MRRTENPRYHSNCAKRATSSGSSKPYALTQHTRETPTFHGGFGASGSEGIVTGAFHRLAPTAGSLQEGTPGRSSSQPFPGFVAKAHSLVVLLYPTPFFAGCQEGTFKNFSQPGGITGWRPPALGCRLQSSPPSPHKATCARRCPEGPFPPRRANLRALRGCQKAGWAVRWTG